MTKSSPKRAMKKASKKQIEKAGIKRRNLNPQELKEYIELVKLCNAEHWKAGIFTGNTAIIHNGKEVAKQQESIARLLENSKNNWLSRVLAVCGIPLGQAVNINSETGEIKEVTEPQPIKTTKPVV